MKTCLTQLKEFIASDLRNKWLSDRTMTMYVRKSHRFLEGDFHTTLDLATCEVAPRKRRKGVCNAFLAQVEQSCPYEYIFIENVMVEGLAASLENHGWRKVNPAQPIPSYYKKAQAQCTFTSL